MKENSMIVRGTAKTLNFMIVLLLSTYFVILFLSPVTYALDWSFNPSVTLSSQYDSNLRFSAINERSDFIAALIPKLSGSGLGEDMKLDFGSTVTCEKYVDNDNFDTIDYDFAIALNKKWSTRFSTDVNTKFVHDSTLNDQLQQAGITTVRTERFLYDLSLSETYALTDRWSLKATEIADYVQYPSGLLPDSKTWIGSLTPAWMFTERDTFGVSSTFSYSDYLDSSTIKNLAEMLYWERALTEASSLQVGGGYRLTWIVNDSLEQMDDGFIFLLLLRKDWSDRLSTAFSLGRDEYNSADARTFERNYARISAKYGISDLTTLSCDLNYNLNSETGQEDTEIHYVQIAPSIIRKITKDLSIRLAGSYEHQQNDVNSGGQNPERFRTWVEISWQFPRLWATH